MRFFVSDTNKAALIAARDRIYSTGDDRQLYFHVGYFATKYAMVEIWLTYLLARATKIHDMEAFELLTYGLDAKAKVDRLLMATEGRLGPNLEARLDYFYKHLTKARNRVAHTAMSMDAVRDIISFSTVNQFPQSSPDRPPTSKPAYEIPTLEFFELAAWLDLFNKDLETVKRAIGARGIFEIDRPQSPLPPAQNLTDPQKAKRATPGRRERKRQRKGQQLRGTRKPAE